jgi:hypothetical protein
VHQRGIFFHDTIAIHDLLFPSCGNPLGAVE